MKIFIQTNNNFVSLQKACLNSWQAAALSAGYKIRIIDYREHDKSYIDNLIDFCKEDNLCYVGVAFDDLYVKKCKFPNAIELLTTLTKLELHYLRLDGRPPATGDFCVKIGNIDYFYIRNGRHDLSLVFSFFSIDLLLLLKSKNIVSPWDIERYCRDNNVRGVSPKVRTFRYSNLIVKNKIDIISLLQSGQHLPLHVSIKKFVSRLIKRFIQL